MYPDCDAVYGNYFLPKSDLVTIVNLVLQAG